MTTVTYDLGNIADWLSAIGTIGAVIVALYLANRDVKPKIKVTSKFSYLVSSISGISDEPDYISVDIVNQGLVPIYITECTIKIRKEKIAFFNGCHTVNKLLNPGELHTSNLEFIAIKEYLIQKKINKISTYIFCKDAIGNTYKSKKIKLRA